MQIFYFWSILVKIQVIKEGAVDTFDYVIIGLGIALIIIGLFLFVSSKKGTPSSNQVEGFGIKLNVSNPSIILIVFGIGLVLFPRIMPNKPVDKDFTKITPPTDQASGNEQQTAGGFTPAVNAMPDNTPPANTSSVNNTREPVVTRNSSNIYFPNGTWQLTQYEENGYDLSANVRGSINFVSRSQNTQNWIADFQIGDGWGNVQNNQYVGTINAAPGGYTIETQSSTDPQFFRQAPSNLIMKLDSPNALHMEYMSFGSMVILHFRQ